MSDHTVYGIFGTLIALLALLFAYLVGVGTARGEIRAACDNYNTVMLEVERDEQAYLCIRKAEVEKARF